MSYHPTTAVAVETKLSSIIHLDNDDDEDDYIEIVQEGNVNGGKKKASVQEGKSIHFWFQSYSLLLFYITPA
jgi:hypothetical protein